MKKHCVDCGIIFYTDDPDKERCELCEDDRNEEDDADCDYLKNWYRLRRYRRRYRFMKPGIAKRIAYVLIFLMHWVNEKFIRGCD